MTTPVLVTTPTGHVGSQLVPTLLQTGAAVRVLCRDPDRLAPDIRPRVDVRVGDQLDADDVRAAVAGAGAVYWVSPESFTAADPLADLVTMADHLEAAVRAERPARVVLQSSVGAELRSGAGLIDGLAAAEQRLDAAADDGLTAVLHLRCGYFMTNLALSVDALRGGFLPTTADPAQAVPWVAPADVAAVAAVQLVGPPWSGRRVRGVHGPADLTPAEVCAVLGEVLGRPVSSVQEDDASAAAELRAAGLSEAAVAAVVGMTAGLRGRAPDPPRDELSTTPTSLAVWAATELCPLVAGD